MRRRRAAAHSGRRDECVSNASSGQPITGYVHGLCDAGAEDEDIPMMAVARSGAQIQSRWAQTVRRSRLRGSISHRQRGDHALSEFGSPISTCPDPGTGLARERDRREDGGVKPQLDIQSRTHSQPRFLDAGLLETCGVSRRNDRK